MVFYNEKKELYTETDASGVGLGESLLQMRDGMWFQRNEAPDNVALQPIAYASQSTAFPVRSGSLRTTNHWWQYSRKML